MFQPRRCPRRSCRYHARPVAGFYQRKGFYHPRCRSHPVARFRCRGCGGGFSRQTFRADYRHKKPHINARFLELMVACVGQRQCARVLHVARRTVERRFEWLARHAAHYHRNRLDGAVIGGPFQLDELESFEANRFQPVTVPVLIERATMFIVSTAVGPLRRKGRLSPAQRRQRDRLEAEQGRRRPGSAPAVRRVLRCLAGVAAGSVVLESDRKPLYGALARRILGDAVVWRTHDAAIRRDRANPLFASNHTNARLRHFLSRLRRRTWCVSRTRAGLEKHLRIATLWVDYCRGITNKTRTTPAQALGLIDAPRRPEQLLGWRQDWGKLSAEPFGRS